MIRINLYDYREDLQRAALQKQAVSAFGLVCAWLLLAVLIWFFEQTKINSIEYDVKQLEDEIKVLDEPVQKVKEMQTKIKRTGEIIVGIQALRNRQQQPAGLLDDLNQFVPNDMWLSDIRQFTKKTLAAKGELIKFEGGSDEIIRIEGYAINDGATAEYARRLEGIDYFQAVILAATELKTDVKNIAYDQVWSFTIYCHRKGKDSKDSKDVKDTKDVKKAD